MADRYIINKCLNGDSTAFGMLVDKYKESVYALAYSKLRNFHDAEDVTQEAFMKAYQNLRTLRQWDDFHAWIYAITYNICKMMIRSRSRQPDREFIEDQTVKSLHIEGSYHDDPMLELLHEALDSLPETYQQVLTLHYLGGMDGTEIAEFLGMSPTSIWQRLSRARSLLRKEMLDIMSETFEQNRLKAGFTFRIVEMVKRIRLNPISPKALPWGLSLATGIIIAVLSIGTHLSIINPTGSMSGSPLPSESKVLKVGEIPVDVMKVSNISVLSNQRWKGNGLGSVVPSLQNALFMAPQAEGGTWTKKADMLTPRSALSTSVVNGKIYAIGGINDNEKQVSTVEEYDPITNTWKKKADMPTKRSHLSTSVVNGKIYAMGGEYENEVVTAIEEYDPVIDKWKKKADMPSIRYYFSSSVVNGKIYIIGGDPKLIGGDPNIFAGNSVEEYDPINETWVRKASIPTIRDLLSTSVVNGKIYAIGGSGQWPDANLPSVEEYDPATDTWTKKADMPTARYLMVTVVVNGKIYAFGGYNNDLWFCSMVEEYDPKTDTWTKKTNMPLARNNLSASAVNEKVYIIGGYNIINNVSTNIPEVEEYDPGTTGQSINPKGKLPTTWGDVKLARNK
jgi:RNA polymerase sigma factor (sigma-70 family)